MTNRRERERGVTLILVVMIAAALMVLSAVSIDRSLSYSVTRDTQEQVLLAREVADSAVAQALALIKEGGVSEPVSGGGVNAQWVAFSEGGFYYYTVHDPSKDLSTIRAWGRVPAGPNPSSSTVAPDDITWDGTDWMVRGVEVTILGTRYIPDVPVFFGNGGIQRPLGGFDWNGGSDPFDPSTWSTVTSSPDSYQASTVPFQSSALDHPIDYLYNGGTPAPASVYPHPYKIWASQNPIGQQNIEAWFTQSAGTGNDPTINVTPPPTSTYYNTADDTSPDYPYPVDGRIPDVQTLADEIWNQYQSHPIANQLAQGSHSGTYGDLTNPSITFVTGKLTVSAGQTFKGAGILVIRDDYDPNVDTSNTPSTKANLLVQGTLEWTGLVMVTGWAPDITVETGGDATIVGTLMGEDSVQSGGEISLDSATIGMRFDDDFRVLFSYGLFGPGGLIHPYLPRVKRRVLAIREI